MPTSFESILVLLVFALPGYISVKVRSTLRTGQKLDSVALAIEFIFFATANVLLTTVYSALFFRFGWLTIPVVPQSYGAYLASHSQNSLLSPEVLQFKLLSENRNTWVLWRLIYHNLTPIVGLFLLAFFTAVGFGLAAGKWNGTIRLGKWTIISPINPFPSAWDQFFLHTPNCIIHVKWPDGSNTAGLFHSRSYAALGPEHDLFLEKEIAVDQEGRLISEIEDSSGILVDLKQMKELHIYPLSLLYEEQNGNQENNQRERQTQTETASEQHGKETNPSSDSQENSP